MGQREDLRGAVLIVSDRAADRALLRTILDQAGYTIHEVSKGHDALEKAGECRPHLIIVDSNLPASGCLSLCRAIRAARELTGVPVLMLTLGHDDAEVGAGLEAGADDYVSKDAAWPILLGRVQRLIQFRQMTSMAMLNQQLVQVGRLLAGIVHEIRGPLSVIRGSAELLAYTSSIQGEAEQWLDAIRRNARLLQVRLDHLMATVRNRSSHPKDIELLPLVHESVQLFLKGLPPGGEPKFDVQITSDGEVPFVCIDPGRLMQVLFNLLGNARQALAGVNQAGHLIMRVGAGEDEGKQWVTIDVIDDGPGIPEIFLDRVFEPFFSTRDDGTGYGLYLATELLKEQSGRISARNNGQGGATFTIWLPWPTRTPEVKTMGFAMVP